MADLTYVYVSYIAATPEQVWQALTDPKLIVQYWEEWEIKSDWKVGSPVEFHFAPENRLYSVGKVIESDPPRKLVYDWPEENADGSQAPELLIWEITPSGREAVKLQLTQQRLSDEWYQAVSTGWPIVISGIKSLLETGRKLVVERPEPSLDPGTQPQ